MVIKLWKGSWDGRSYRDTVSDSDCHHGCLSEAQEAFYAVFILHVKEHFGQLDTDLKKQTNMNHCVKSDALRFA